MNIRVLVVFSSHRTLESGGVGTHLRHLIDKVSESNYEHSILLGVRKSLLYKRAFRNIIDSIFKSKEEKSIAQFMNMIYSLSEELELVLNKYDKNNTEFVIHCHERQTVFAASLLRKKYNLKIIQTLHAPFAEQYEITHPSDTPLQQFTKIIDAGLVMESEHLIAVDALQAQIAESKVAKQLSIKEVINAVNINLKVEDKSLIKDKYGIDNYIVVARHLQKKNGVEFAIKAFAKLKHKEYSLFIAGDGPERSALTSLIEELGLSKQVFLLGKQANKDALNIIAHAKLSLVPSVPIGIYIEAASLTMLESMLLKTPVVASNIGGLKQVLDHNITGILVKEGDDDSLAKEIDRILDDSTLYDNIVENAHKLIVEEYNTNKWFANIAEIYDIV